MLTRGAWRQGLGCRRQRCSLALGRCSPRSRSWAKPRTGAAVPQEETSAHNLGFMPWSRLSFDQENGPAGLVGPQGWWDRQEHQCWSRQLSPAAVPGRS